MTNSQNYVVTGGATGMGAQLVSELRAEGHRVTVLDLHTPAVQPDQSFSVDLADVASVRAVATQLAAGEAIDGLIHCAGIPEDVADAETVFAVNFLGLRELTEQLLPHLAPRATVLSIASIASHRWRQRLAEYQELFESSSVEAGLEWYRNTESVRASSVYAISKEAVAAYTTLLAARLLSAGIRVNAVSPGLVNTRLLEHFTGAMSTETHDRMRELVGEPLQPSNVTAVMRFLLSDDATWVNGQNLVVDGGYLVGAEFAKVEVMS